MAVLASPDVGIRGRALLRKRRIDSPSNAYSADRRRMRDQRYSLRGRLIAEKNPSRQALIFRFCYLCSICYKIDSK